MSAALHACPGRREEIPAAGAQDRGAVIERINRPTDGTAPGESIGFGPYRLLPKQRILLEGDRPLHLGSRAMEILIALVERGGEVVSQNDLMDLVWPNIHVEETNLRVHIAALRRVLGDG